MAHSKRNTSRSIFTSYERDLAKRAWGCSSARLTRESFLPFASCCLCLEPAADPVACLRGDIFCRECALSNILAQKQEIKRLERRREDEAREAREEMSRWAAEEHERAVREFELTQAGMELLKKTEKKAVPALEARRHDGYAQKRGKKRKSSLDQDDVDRVAIEDRAKARKAIHDEKASTHTLSSFWVPSITPSSNKNDTLHDIKLKTKTRPTCPATAPTESDKTPHPYSLHTLVTVNFAEEEDGTSQKHKQRICPSCKRVLSNASKASMVIPCGHVLCKPCVAKFMAPSGTPDPQSEDGHDPIAIHCYVCGTDRTGQKDSDERKPKKRDKEKRNNIKCGLVELRSEGTGFSAGGASQVKKSGVSFQC